MRKIVFLLLTMSFYVNAQTSFSSLQGGFISFLDSEIHLSVDIDNDGDTDLLYYHNDNLILKENLGNFNFTEQTIDSNLTSLNSIIATDLDNDNDLDIVIALYSDNKISYYENAGFNTFGNQITISNSVTGASSIDAFDINNDGLIDIISASLTNGKIYKHQNNGNGTFQTSILISNSPNVKSLRTSDIDDDGDIDIISMSYTQIDFHENINGTFMSDDIYIASANTTFSMNLVYDYNNDGKDDILYGYSNSSSGLSGIAKIINIGNGFFNPPTTIDVGVISRTFDANDFNGNGSKELVYAKRFNPNFPFNYDIIIENIPTIMSGTNISSFGSLDIDNDGDIDIFTTLNGNLNAYWYENFSLEILTQPTNLIIESGNNGVFSFTAKDVLTYQWQLKNGSNFVDIIDNTSFTGTNTDELTIMTPNIGEFVFRCIISNDSGSQNTNEVTLTVQNTVSVEDDLLKTIGIYPNPTNDLINIKTENSIVINAIKIFSLEGKLLKTYNNNLNQLSIKNLSFGLYFLTIETGKGSVIKKIFKNK